MEATPVVNITQEAVVKFLQSIIYRFGVPRGVLTDNGTQFKGVKFLRYCADFEIQDGQVERTNGLLLQGMKMRMFQDLEAKGKNWHKDLPSVLWALRTNVNRATRDTPFSLVYGAEVVLPPEVYLKSARVAQFSPEDQTEVRELDANLLEERYNTTLSNVRKYQLPLKKYYNKSVVQRELHIGDLVLKKDIRTKDKHEFLTPWQGPYIIVDVAAPVTYVLAEVDGGMLPNTWKADQLRKYYVLYLYMIREAQFFLTHKTDIVSIKNLVFWHA
jgi:hypothetical protein